VADEPARIQAVPRAKTQTGAPTRQLIPGVVTRSLTFLIMIADSVRRPNVPAEVRIGPGDLRSPDKSEATA
jgi:hypothetical protein